LLDARVVSNFSGGLHLVWHLRGDVRFRITGQNLAGAMVSGLFIDPATNRPPSLAWIEPADGAALTAPAEVWLQVKCKDPDGVVNRVEFILNDEKLGDAGAPFQLAWSNAPAGTHEVFARAVDNFGQAGTPVVKRITVGLPPARARFLRVDDTTQGDWPGAYGADGHAILFHATNLPAYGQLGIRDAQDGYWAYSDSDPRALVTGSGRLASSWYSPTNLTLDVRLIDGRSHQLALYFLDWDSGSRRQRVEVFDAASGAVLDAREVSGFYDAGRYLSWSVRGHVRVRLTRLIGQAVFSGAFFDSFATPQAEWAASRFSPQERADATISGDAADPDGDQLPNLVEYALGSNPLAFEHDARPQVELRDGHLWITYRRSTRAPEVAFTLDHATQLGSWGSAESQFDTVETLTEGERETVVLRTRQPVTGSAAGFFRLRVRRIEP
jgi:hypothetical protein